MHLFPSMTRVTYHFTYSIVYMSTHWSISYNLLDIWYNLNSVTDTEDISVCLKTKWMMQMIRDRTCWKGKAKEALGISENMQESNRKLEPHLEGWIGIICVERNLWARQGMEEDIPGGWKKYENESVILISWVQKIREEK